MAITINGNGTITGVGVGGMPDGSITNADIAAGTITNAEINASAAIDGTKLAGIKTVNGESIIGSGDVEVGGGFVTKASNLTGSGTFTTPADVTEIFVLTIGAGGGGNSPNVGQGGYGGNHNNYVGPFAKDQTPTWYKRTVTPAEQFSYSGGVGGDSSTTDGTSSSFGTLTSTGGAGGGGGGPGADGSVSVGGGWSAMNIGSIGVAQTIMPGFVTFTRGEQFGEGGPGSHLNISVGSGSGVSGLVVVQWVEPS